jgi:hypothetical protein
MCGIVRTRLDVGPRQKICSFSEEPVVENVGYVHAVVVVLKERGNGTTSNGMVTLPM